MKTAMSKPNILLKTAATEIKIAYIGGGSIGWAPMLMRDLALTEKISGELVLYDINETAARHNVERGKIIFSHKEAKTSFNVRATGKLADALKGADFVVMSIQPGPMRMFANDLDIPLRYGIVQPVGDSTGPGGISRALRSVPIYVEYARQIMRHCPKAWVINYTNPMTLCTSALYAAEPGIKAFGCCHEVFGTQKLLSGLIKEYWGDEVAHRSEIKFSVNGVNHFTFVPKATWRGRDLYPLIKKHVQEKGLFADKTEEAVKKESEGKVFGSCGALIAFDLYRRFGVLGAAGDRHLAEFVPWYARSSDELHRWGVCMTTSSFRLNFRPEISKNSKLSDRDSVIETLAASGEEGVRQILAILGLGDLDTNVNLPNRGQISDLPLNAIVETNAQFRRDSVTPVTAAPVPAGVNALIARIVRVQRMTLDAAMACDKDLAFQAILNDPLVTIPTDKAWKMFNEMLKANAAMLPKKWNR